MIITLDLSTARCASLNYYLFPSWFCQGGSTKFFEKDLDNDERLHFV